MKTRLIAVAAMSLVYSVCSLAQQQYIYPAKGQSPETQKQDEYECHVWASGQTGYDPTRSEQAASTSTSGSGGSGTGRALARGAATGAVVGAATDNKVGASAVAGAAIGGAVNKGSTQRAAQKSQQQAAAELQTKKNEYARARSACLEGRGYTVK